MRREILEKYGEKKLYEGGLSVRTTLDPKMQVMAKKAFADGLINFDEAHGYRGAGQQDRHHRRLGRRSSPTSARSADVAPWRLAVVLDVNDQSARIGFQPRRVSPAAPWCANAQIGNVPLDGVKWAKAASGPTATRR